MFKEISWEWFAVIAGLITGAYYVVILMLYYKNEILQIFIPKAANNLIKVEQEDRSSDNNNIVNSED